MGADLSPRHFPPFRPFRSFERIRTIWSVYESQDAFWGVEVMERSSSEEIISTRSLDQFLASQDRLIKLASKALPHSFDRCTHSLGHIRQAIYWCKTCGESRGLCSACSIACHGSELNTTCSNTVQELASKRNEHSPRS